MIIRVCRMCSGLFFERTGYYADVSPDAKCNLKNDFDHPDVIIPDRHLSGVEGMDVYRFVKEKIETRKIPAIMVSASPDIADVAIRVSAEAFTENPF